MTNISNSTFYELLPPNLRDAKTRALSAALDRQKSDLLAHIAITLIYADPSNLDENICDFLAMSFDIKAYDCGFPLHVKREILRFALDAYSRNGTAAVVKQMVEIVSEGHARIDEWWEYDGQPYCFRLTLYDAGRPITIALFDKLRDTVSFYKPVRSWLDKFTLVVSASAWAGPSQRHKFGVRATISLWGIKTILLDGGHTLNSAWILSSLWSRGPHFQSFSMRFPLSARPRTVPILGVTASVPLAHQATAKLGMAVALPTKIRLRHKRFGVAGRIEHQIGSSAHLVADTMWRLDNTVTLNGTRKLNADIVHYDL